MKHEKKHWFIVWETGEREFFLGPFREAVNSARKKSKENGLCFMIK